MTTVYVLVNRAGSYIIRHEVNDELYFTHTSEPRRATQIALGEYATLAELCNQYETATGSDAIGQVMMWKNETNP